MPITPLHFGVIPVINCGLTTKLSAPAFIIANVLADLPVLSHLYASKVHELGGPAVTGILHETFTHTFLGALMLGVFLSLFRFKSKAWWLGCLIGTVSHVTLDMFVHSDVSPFAPLSRWNPLYFDVAHAWFSIVLGVGLVWWVLQLRDQRKADRQTKHVDSQTVPDVPS